MTDRPTYVTVAVQVVVDASVSLPDLFVIRSRAAGRLKGTESCRKKHRRLGRFMHSKR